MYGFPKVVSVLTTNTGKCIYLQLFPSLTEPKEWNGKYWLGFVYVISVTLYAFKTRSLDFEEVSSYLSLPYLTLPFLSFPYLTFPYITLHYLTLPHITLPYLSLPYLTLPFLTLPYLSLPYLTFLSFPYLTLPNLT